MNFISSKKIILASKSKARAALLSSAGIEFDILPAKIDEEAIRDALLNDADGLSAIDLAELLSRTKAQNISEAYKSAFVIGADQTMSCKNILFHKARTIEEAKENFYFMRGKTHSLHSAVSIAQNGEIIWSYTDEAHLTMINFSNEFLGAYLGKMGDEVLTTVGGYQLENMGSLLFEKIIGDYHTILGLPLLPVLTFMREQKAILS